MAYWEKRFYIFYFVTFVWATAGLINAQEVSHDYFWDNGNLRNGDDFFEYQRRQLTCDEKALHIICYKTCGIHYICEDKTCKCTQPNVNFKGVTEDTIAKDNEMFKDLMWSNLNYKNSYPKVRPVELEKEKPTLFVKDQFLDSLTDANDNDFAIAKDISKKILWKNPNAKTDDIMFEEFRRPITCDEKVLQIVCYKSCGKHFTCANNKCKCIVPESDQKGSKPVDFGKKTITIIAPSGKGANKDQFLESLTDASDNNFDTVKKNSKKLLMSAPNFKSSNNQLKFIKRPITCDEKVLQIICYKTCGKHFTCEDNTCKCIALNSDPNLGLTDASDNSITTADNIATAKELSKKLLLSAPNYKGDDDDFENIRKPNTCDEKGLSFICYKTCGKHFTCEDNICRCTEPEAEQNNGNKDNNLKNALHEIEKLLNFYDKRLTSYIGYPQALDRSPPEKPEESGSDEFRTEDDPEYEDKTYLRHHIAHFCPDLEVARKCIRKCMKLGKPAFCGKDHVCYCGHRYSSHDEYKQINLDDTYAEFRDLYEKYFGPRSNEQELKD